MENPTTYLIKKVCSYFVTTTNNLEHSPKLNTLVRIHDEKLQQLGDVSFPVSSSIWQNYFAAFVNEVNVKALESLQNPERTEAAKIQLIASAAGWTYPVQEVRLQHGRCTLFLNRFAVVHTLLKQALASNGNNSYGCLRKKEHARICIQNASDVAAERDDLQIYRAQLVERTLRNILEYSQWTLLAEDQADTTTIQLQVASVAIQAVSNSPKHVRMLCGLVLDPTSGKVAHLSSADLRSADMRLMAMHKYGIRVKDDKRFCELIERLGAAAVTVDFLEVKHSSPVRIKRNGQGSTKGASFILYNSARLETLLRTFDERVSNASYAPLPALEDVDIGLLREPEEWQLLFGYIFQFPNLIESCMEQIASGSCATHLIVRYLSGFVALFSVYYRRIRILTETRNQLMPYVYARIYLVKAVQVVLNKSLALLNIEPMMFM